MKLERVGDTTVLSVRGREFQRGIVPGKKEYRNWVVLAVMFLNCRGWEFLLLWCMTLNLSGGSGKSVWWLTILYM